MLEALDAAVATHFGTLFQVLMVDPSDGGMQRFKKGLSRLADAEKTVRDIVGKMEE